jgi:hypothetical protein
MSRIVPQRVLDAMTRFSVGGVDVGVFTRFGFVQVVALFHEAGEAAPQITGTAFANRGTAAELRALADHLDGIDWVALDEGPYAA